MCSEQLGQVISVTSQLLLNDEMAEHWGGGCLSPSNKLSPAVPVEAGHLAEISGWPETRGLPLTWSLSPHVDIFIVMCHYGV